MYNKNSSFNVLYISDVNVTHDFYKSIGAEIAEVKDDKVVVNIGDFNLHFVLGSTEPFDEYFHATKKEGRGQGNIFYIETDDIEKVYETLQNSEAVLKSFVKLNHWDGKEFMFEDPDGYKFVVYQLN